MDEKLFDLVGLEVPFALAAATYGFFWWLDSNASDEVTQIVSSWLQGRSQHKPDLGNVIISAFDRIYTSPILSFRAFRRSVVISSIIWVLVFLIPWLIHLADIWDAIDMSSLVLVIFEAGVLLSLIVLTDYLSLLFVRRFLALARIHPISASIMSSLVGLLVVIVSFF
jgi:hypothetical protein